MKEQDGDITNQYLACESRVIFELLMMSSGMMGAYTMILRGGVFCNAQTANFVLMAIELGNGNWSKGFYYLIPITAYLMGAIMSELLPNPIKKIGLFRWDTYLIGFELIVLLIIGFIPLTVTDKVVQVAINFICSMQYNTFRQAQGIPMSTTFCTNHLRQIGISIAKYLRKGDKSLLKKGKTHTLMLSSFIMGAIILAAACNILKEKAIWIAMIPLFINLCILVYADLIQERHLLERTPLGH